MRLIAKISGVMVGVLASVVLISGGAAAQTASGGIGGRPANPDPNNPRTQSIFIFTAHQGDTKADTVLVSNNSSTTRTISIYPVDGIVTNTGAYTCSQESQAQQGMGSWIKLSQSTLTLDAGKTQEVPFTLTVPTTADVGEHDACIVFQDENPASSGTGSIRITTRQAIRVVATIPGNLHRDISIDSFTVHQTGGHQLYVLNLKNNGNVSADVDTHVELDSLFGGTAYTNGGGYPVLPNQKLELSFDNSHRPFFGGWYYSRASISYNKQPGTFGTADSADLISKSSGSTVVFIAPTAGGSIVLIVAGATIAALAIWLLKRRRRVINALKTWRPYEVKSRDNLQSIALRHGIDWKHLASINNIRPPYVLEPGQMIQVPSAVKHAAHKTE